MAEEGAGDVRTPDRHYVVAVGVLIGVLVLVAINAVGGEQMLTAEGVILVGVVIAFLALLPYLRDH